VVDDFSGPRVDSDTKLSVLSRDGTPKCRGIAIGCKGSETPPENSSPFWPARLERNLFAEELQVALIEDAPFARLNSSGPLTDKEGQ